MIPGGWLDGHWIQLPWHIADSAAGLSYSFVVTVRNPPPYKKRLLYPTSQEPKNGFPSYLSLSHTLSFSFH